MGRQKKHIYAWDFETVVNEEHTRVWLWGQTDIDSMEFKHGTSIESFMDEISRANCKGYFHNLRFDGNFIIYWLLHHEFAHTSQRNPQAGEFSTLISDMGVFYRIAICFNNRVRVEILDSLKLMTMPVKDIPKAFDLQIEKLALEYEKVVYEEDYEPDERDIEYVKHDCDIVAMGLAKVFSMGLKKMTTAANAMDYYKKLKGKEFDRLYPQLTLSTDIDIRKAYRGGWTYLNPKYKDLIVDEGQVYDVNSMYPWAMRDCLLPYGDPIYFDGRYEEDKVFPLYVQCFSCCFKLKENHFPTIQIKGSFRFSETEYLSDSGGLPVLLTLTNIDMELFLDSYEVWDTEYINGYKFRGASGQFKDYVDYWYGVKREAKKTGNKAMSFQAKLYLNSLYGRFGKNPLQRSKFPFLGTDDIVHYETGGEEQGETSYVPVAAFITSYCRDKIIRTADKVYDRFVYADTDSIHILGKEIPDIDIDEYRLGAFKLESSFVTAKFHRAKCYIEDSGEELLKKCAGLPQAAREKFVFETMKEGIEFSGKLVPKAVPGGIVLVDRKFTIK